MLAVVKSNIAMKPDPLEWSRAEDSLVTWHGASQHRIDELLGGATSQPRDDGQGLLREALKGGSKPVRELFALAKAAGISEMTLRRAANALNVDRFKMPGVVNGPWLWKLPNGPGEHDNIDPDKSKVITPIDTDVITFESSDTYGKVLTDSERDHLRLATTSPEDDHLGEDAMEIEDDHETAREHLPRDTGGFEGDHLAVLMGDHLRSSDESAGGGKEVVTWTG